MDKVLTVATEIQRAIFEQVILPEISGGFWKNVRPLDHSNHWDGVKVVLGHNLGISGFKSPRSYNFVNPEFYKKNQDRLIQAAKTVNPDITVRQLKRQLISLNQIVGSRLKEVGGEVIKIKRLKKNGKTISLREKKTANVTVRKMMATFLEDVGA
jgi:hypothetical protein